MNCIFCHSTQTCVIDSRTFDDCVQRRRQCYDCDRRFTTVEKPLAGDNHRKYAPLGREQGRTDHYYTVYNAKTDEVLACGNAYECARMLNIRRNSFYRAVMDSNRGKCTKYYILTDKEKDIESHDD